MDIIKRITNTKARTYINVACHTLGIFFTALLLGSKAWGTDMSILKAAFSPYLENVIYLVIVGIAALFVGFGIAGAVASLLKKKFASTAFSINFVMLVIIIAVGSVLEIIGNGGKAAVAFALITELLGFVYSILCKIFGEEQPSVQSEPKTILDPTFNVGGFKTSVLVITTLSMAFLLLAFFVPFCTYTLFDTGEKFSIIPSDFLGVKNNMIIGLPVFILLFIAYAVSGSNYLAVVSSYKLDFDRFMSKAKITVYGNTVIAAVYYLISVGFCFWQNVMGENFKSSTFLTVVLTLAASVAYAVVLGISSDKMSIKPKDRKTNLRKIELLVYGILLGGISMLSLVVDIIVVRFDIAGSSVSGIKLNGFNLITMYPKLGAGFQLAAFLVFTCLVVSATLTAIMIISIISRSRLYYKISAFALAANGFIAFALGIVGKYYQIATKVNEEVLRTLIGNYVNIDGIDFTYTVSSQSFRLFLAAMAVIALVLFRTPYTKGLEAQEEGVAKKTRKSTQKPQQLAEGAPKAGADDVSENDFDACPAFTELDSKVGEYTVALRKRRETPFERATLPSLVQFVVDYARDSRLHLSYTVDDIAAFVAGLGATKLTILQGMSGTGKTSLPKIFMEAIMGNCEIIEVESSWRDKNELLGYYNEFSKTYTPKKFTQALYKSTLNPDVVVFIVLDELNLSRIEYYFSDFLSLMENEEGKREIKLLNVKLYNTVDGEKYSYSALTDDHTLKVPSNVWFVGTANRDESTFEISDKVYDRAHTMNFNKRAKKPASYGSQPFEPKYLSYRELEALLEDAKSATDFDIEKVEVVKEVEDILTAYNISFGNRIARQIEDFVKVYCACFYDGEQRRDEAIEKILLSKVVSKLEYKNVDNKEALAVEFERLGLHRCAEFVRKLNED